MKWRVLISAPYMIPVLPEFEPPLREQGIEVRVADVNERLGEAELIRWLPDVDGVICGDDAFTERVLRQFPRLKVISKWGTGTDSIDRAAAARLGIAVCNTPGAFTDPVADTVLGYVLAFARQSVVMDRRVRAGIWHKTPGVSLRESVLGVIGVGDIGAAVCQRAAAFGMRILGTDPVEPPAVLRDATGVQMVSKATLLREADFVSLNCDLNPTSRHIMSGPEFAAMKPTAFVINTARGPLIDEAALVTALRERRIAGAALDVFEVEPLPLDSPLRAFETCLLAPHNANASPAAARRVHENTIRNLVAALEGVAC